MKYSIVFIGTEAGIKSNSLFIKPNTKASQALDVKTVVVEDISIVWDSQLFRPFQSGNVSLIIDNIRNQMKGLTLSYLRSRSSELSRRKDSRLAVQNYIDEIGLIIALPVSLHLDYFQQKNALKEAEWLAAFPSPDFSFPISNIHDGLTLTELYIINAMKRKTDKIDLSTYLTCAELSRMTEIPPELIKRALMSPSLQPFVRVKKVDGCKAQTLEFTDQGKAEFLINQSSKEIEESEMTTKTTILKPMSFPLAEYSYHTHLALMKRLTDEYKKILKSNTPISELQKVASLALCLMGAI
ncbi:MAG: hypothetical protein ACK5NC_04015 [Vibrio sp.]